MPSLTNPPRKPLIVLLATILLLRGRILSIKSRVKLPQLRGKKLTPEELLNALQQIYTVEDGVKTLLVPYRDRLHKVRSLESQFSMGRLSGLLGPRTPHSAREIRVRCATLSPNSGERQTKH